MRYAAMGLLIFLFALGCRKDALYNTIQGTWELRETSGGWTGIKSYEPGNDNLLIFSGDNRYTYKFVGADTAYTLLYTYSLIKEDECYDNLVLRSKTGDEFRQRAIVSHDTLYLSDGCIIDGGSSIYVRK